MLTATRTNRRLYLPGRRLLTRFEFERVADSGAFGPEERLELIEGEIIAQDLPLKPSCATAVSLVEIALRRAFAEGYYVRGQLPLALGEYNEPLPDIAVVIGSVRDYENDHPTTAVLIAEIADTSLRYDRVTKAGLYARAGVPEFWIININERVLEVYREVVPMRVRAFGYYYAQVTTYTEEDAVSPLAVPDAVIAVSELLPRRRP